MTTATAELCGHRWPGGLHINDQLLPLLHHRCDEPADHPPWPHGHRCRCGATTERSTTDGA